MEVRWFNPENDDVGELGKLNPFGQAWQDWMKDRYQDYKSVLGASVMVLANDGELVGCLHVFDVGLPWTILDGMYLKPGFRTLKNAQMLGYGTVEELKKRGVQLIQINAAGKLATVLEKRYGCRAAPDDYKMLIKVIYAGDYGVHYGEKKNG